MPRKTKTPWYARVRISCPDCGQIVNYGSNTEPFDCPRCEAHYPAQEFWSLHKDKLSKSMGEEG
jgi:hypothetical protein